MDALADKEIDYCILSTASLLKLRPDIMLAEFMTRPLTILGEFALATDLCLCALPGTTMHECDCVMSDSTLLKMSEALILKLENDRGSPIVRQAAWDSAGACFIPPCLPAVLQALADTYAHIVDIQTCSSIVPELQVLITFMPSVPSPFAKIPQQLLQCLDHLSNSMHVFDAYFSLATVP
ncbi:hypothetical protein PRIC1_006879 [Phytophthora ramorum]